MKPNLCLINNILFLVFVLEKPFIFLLYNVGPALSCIPLVLLFCLRVMTSCHHMISFFFFFCFPGLGVWSITGWKSILLCSSWQRSLSGTRWFIYWCFLSAVTYNNFVFVWQPDAEDVFYSLLHTWKDHPEADREQVNTAASTQSQKIPFLICLHTVLHATTDS